MKAGPMKYRLKVQEPVITKDKYHAERVVWTGRGTVWAERVKNTGYRREEVGELFPEHRAEYNVRIAHKIGENWRVTEIGGLEYTVTATIPNKERGMLTLICERVNK